MEAARPATPEDLARVAELLRDERAELVAMRGGAIWAAREARPDSLTNELDALLADEDRCVTVGTIDGVVIGIGIAEIEHLRDGTRLARLTDLFVDPEARAIGVGEAIVETVIAFAAAHGCIGIDALALPGHRAAKNFFEDQGFTARALVMHRTLR